MPRIGTAGWSIPSTLREVFPATGSLLERYATRVNCVEINTSFYRPHQKKTYERWARSTPETFRFAVKVPQSVSHAEALKFDQHNLERFVNEVEGLGQKLGVLLVQLPPKLKFEKPRAAHLFDRLHHHFKQPIVCEPRHASWFTAAVDRWLAKRKIARVAADPARAAANAGEPGGWRGISYLRLHGSPRTYYSTYDAKALIALSVKIRVLASAAPLWCIFDNTAGGAALGNALDLCEDIDALHKLPSLP